VIRELFGWVKKIPTPTYGFYGGYYKRCRNRKQGACPIPQDQLDGFYRQHDLGQLDNWQLVKKLVTVRPSELKHPIYGTAHAYGAALVFSVATLFGVR